MIVIWDHHFIRANWATNPNDLTLGGDVWDIQVLFFGRGLLFLFDEEPVQFADFLNRGQFVTRTPRHPLVSLYSPLFCFLARLAYNWLNKMYTLCRWFLEKYCLVTYFGVCMCWYTCWGVFQKGGWAITCLFSRRASIEVELAKREKENERVGKKENNPSIKAELITQPL